MMAIWTDQIFEDIIETMQEGILVLDSDLNILFANRSFYDSFKVTPEETVGSFIYDLGNRQWGIPKLRNLLEEILPKHNRFDNYEVEHDFMNIGHKVMLLNARRLIEEESDSHKILLAIEDITERKEIEAGLEKTRKELAIIKKVADDVSEFAESVINTMREPLISLDQDLRVVTVNRSFYEVFKVKPEETVGQLIYDLGNKQWDIPKLRELLETILPEKTSFDNYEVEHDFATIGRRTMLLNARQIERAMGKERIILLAIEDITERKRLEDLLADSEERYRRVFETASDGIVLVEKREGKIAYANQAIGKMLGYSIEEAIGKKLQDIGIVDIDDFPKIMQNLNEFGITNFTNVSIKTNSGQDIDTDIYLSDRATFVQCNIRDITERVEAHVEQKKLEAQLQQSQKMEAIGTLAGGIAHDFNNILAVILGNAELAASDVPNSNPASESLKEIYRASIRAKDMVHQLLAFSRKSDEESKPIDMAPIIKESMKMLRSAIPTSIDFKQHISDEQCGIMGDATQINQIVMNLVTNAADAMSEAGGMLEVTLENMILQEKKPCFDWVLSPGAYVKLRMRDSGEGIDPQIMERIFDPYFTTKEVGKGTGMGLSVIHGIVKRHGGGIRVESALGKGTLFEIYFPALEETVEEEKEPEGEIKGGSERVLFVDDEESMVNLNRQRLERLGYDVKSTTKPEEALEWFKADPDQFDVIITDMTMPRMTGDRLAAEILKIRPHMPVIICTGYSERMSAKKAAALGVSKYIEKPIDLRDLASSLREVLEGK